MSRFDTIKVAAGTRVSLPCRTDINATVFWGYYSADKGEVFHISVNGRILNGYVDAFEIQQTTLIISKVNVSQSGLYTCIADDGAGEKLLTFLSVIGG